MVLRVATAGAIAALGVLVPADAAVAADADDLAARYAPVVRLVEQAEECGPGEPYRPSDVDAFLDQDTVALRGPWTSDDLVTIGPSAGELGEGLYEYHLDFPGNPLDPGCDYEKWARTLTETSRPTVYAHLASQGNRLALQYWFFYPFNDYNNKHEGDWEMVQLLFAADDAGEALTGSPVEVGYSQHEGGERAAWDDPKLEIVGGTHPVVHVAAGSHANYYDGALYLGRSAEQGVGCDDTRAPAFDVRPDVQVLASDPAVAQRETPWIAFEGRWGERQQAFYNGPTGPNLKLAWTEPVTWADEKGRDHSYAVPAGGVLGTYATGYFCSAIEAGSDTLRNLANNPGPALFAGALVAALLILVGLRTTWRPTTPLRLARRRAWGQTLAAAWRMYAAHARLFIGIGLLTIPVSIVVTALQSGASRAPAVGGLAPEGESGGLLVTVAALLGVALTLLGVALVQAATTRALVEIDEDRPVGVGSAYRLALSGIRPLLGAVAIAAVALGLLGLSVLLAPVALWLVVRWALLVPVSVLEEHRPVGILRRSGALVHHRPWSVAWLLLVTGLLVLVPGPLIGMLLILATNAPLELVNVVAGVTLALLAPFAALTFAYACADARVREQLGEDESGRVLPAEVEDAPRVSADEA